MDKHSPPAFHRSFYGPRYWITWLLLGFFHLLGRLPIPVTLAIGKGLGLLLMRVAGSRRRIAETNIALCFPELSAGEQRRMVRGVMISCGLSIVESAMALWGSPDKFRRNYTFTGLEYLQQAQALGRGVLLVGCHFTTMDVLGRILGFYYRFDMLYRKDPNPLLAYQLVKAREKFIGASIVRSDTRQLIRNLRQGHIIWYAPDQDYGIKHGVFAPFFGVPAATVVATARIAQLGKAVVLPLAHYRDDKGHYQVIVKPPLENYPSGDDLADATRINAIIEAAIRQHPEQYLWVHRRFKTRPAGEPPLYRKKK